MRYNIDINDIIGQWGFSKSYVKNLIEPLQDEHIDLRISSPGGDVDDALDIRQQLLDHGDVTAYIFGTTASAATIIAMGAKHIAMSAYAFFLVHQCRTWVDAWNQMNADEIQDLIDKLTERKEMQEKIDLVIAKIYSDRTGKSIEEIHELMTKETWLTADEAKEWGFIDEVLEDKTGVSNIADMSDKLRRLGLPQIPEDKIVPVDTDSRNLLQVIIDAIRGKEKKPVLSMNTDYIKVNDLLQVEGLAEQEGSIMLSAEQMQTLNKRLAELESEATEKQAAIDSQLAEMAELKQTIENLQAGDGAATKSAEEIVDDINIDAASLFNEVKDLM